MKNLKEYIKEGLFDDLDKREEIGGLNAATEDIKKEIIKWVINNTVNEIYNTKFQFNFNTNPITVNYNGNITFNSDIQYLTNGMFQWREVSGWFSCSYCKLLTSLKGGPEKVGGDFKCNNCESLTSLEGAPEKVGGEFDCWSCPSLKSLEGAPKKVEGWFNCSRCTSLKSLEGAPKKVGGWFNCSRCTSLKSLKGAPKEVGVSFDCFGIGARFTEEDVNKV